MTEQDLPLYEERQTTYPVFYYILTAELLLMVFIMYQGLRDKEYAGVTILAFVFVLLFIVLWNFYHLQINVFTDRIKFNFGLFGKTINFADVKSVTIKPYKFGRYLGFGIRFSPFDQSRGWIARAGNGIEFTTAKRVYFLSTDQSEQLLSVIQERLRK